MWVHMANWFWKQKPVATCIKRKKEDQWWIMILLKCGANMQQIKRNNFELKSFCSRRHLKTCILPAQAQQLKMEMNCSCHLNNADRLPWQMVGCVEEKGQEKNRTAIPAKEDENKDVMWDLSNSDCCFICSILKSIKTAFVCFQRRGSVITAFILYCLMTGGSTGVIESQLEPCLCQPSSAPC